MQTVRVCLILLNDQLDANSFLLMFISILYMFRALSAHHQEIQLYQYDIWYVGDRQVCSLDGTTSKPAYQTVNYTEGHIADIVLIQLNLLMMMLETCRELK